MPTPNKDLRGWEDLKVELGAGTPEFDEAYHQADYDIRLGAAIRRLRRRVGLTQTQLATQMGTSQSAVVRLEAGSVTPTLDTLQRAARALGARLTVRFETGDERESESV